MGAYQKIAQLLHVQPDEPVHIAGMSFTRPEQLAAYSPTHASGVYAWVLQPDPQLNGRRPEVVFAHKARDLATLDSESQHALEKWKELGHSEQELFVAVHHMPDAMESELASVEQRLIALLHPMLNQTNPAAHTATFARSH